MASSSTNSATNPLPSFGQGIAVTPPDPRNATGQSATIAPTFESPEFLHALEQVKQFTQNIFGRPASCKPIEDRETVGDRYMEIRVVDHGKLDEVIARDKEWYQSLLALPPGIGSVFCLAVDMPDE